MAVHINLPGERPERSRSLIHYLEQEEVWRNYFGNDVRIDSMDERYVANLTAWLLRKAPAIQWSLYCEIAHFARQDHGDMAQDALDQMLYELEQPPLQWIRQRPVFKALERRRTEFVSASARAREERIGQFYAEQFLNLLEDQA